MAAKRKSGPDFWVIVGALFFAVFGLPSVALAWGPSVHLWIGDTLIQTIGAALPLTAALLRRHARAFLYGCLAPDFFVGKGSAYHESHCHNWSSGKKLLKNAGNEREQAFALGYMAHLAADVIGHNHFVPNNLYRTFGVHKFGHVYFELHADNLLDHGYVDLADGLVNGMPHADLDAALDCVILKGLIPFSTKKKVFTSWLALANLTRMKGLLRSFRTYSADLLSNDDVRDMMELSLACALEMLRDTEVPMLGTYDPIGAQNIKLAAELRKSSKKAGSYSATDVPFPIPAELRALRASLDSLERREAPALATVTV